ILYYVYLTNSGHFILVFLLHVIGKMAISLFWYSSKCKFLILSNNIKIKIYGHIIGTTILSKLQVTNENCNKIHYYRSVFQVSFKLCFTFYACFVFYWSIMEFFNEKFMENDTMRHFGDNHPDSQLIIFYENDSIFMKLIV
ncbi:hypothetical protein L9F63_003827, partial [Diploptera punctata]